MAKLPRTPDLARLRDTAPSLRVVGDVRLHRIYERGGNFPTLWNAFRHIGPLSRFDHHLGLGGDAAKPRGTLYAAADIPTAVAEFFQATRQINRARRQPWLVSFMLSHEVRLLDLTSASTAVAVAAPVAALPLLGARAVGPEVRQRIEMLFVRGAVSLARSAGERAERRPPTQRAISPRWLLISSCP